jgi:hypothetical protein
MPIYAERNLYPGVNAHLNSYLQLASGGMWEPFHANYITYLTAKIDASLPPGYYALSEKSLQIGHYEGSLSIPARTIRTRPDISIYRNPSAQREVTAAPAITPPTYTLPLFDILEDEDRMDAIAIYQVKEGVLPGRLVARIEVLSPGNKQQGAHYEQYMSKRFSTLKSGLLLVEIDFLHHSPPLLEGIPNYPTGEASARPYMLLVSDPRPTYGEGQTAVYTIGVLDELPVIPVRLVDSDVVAVDFDAPYQQTIASFSFFRNYTDYATDPPAFDRFTPADQAALSAFLADIRAQHTPEEA